MRKVGSGFLAATTFMWCLNVGEAAPLRMAEGQAKAAKASPCSKTLSGAGKAIGAAIGGWAGNRLAKDSDSKGVRVAATAAGVVGGAVVGGKIACGLRKDDQERLAKSTQHTVSTGQATSWSNPETGARGRASVTSSKKESATFDVPVIKDKVAKIPPLELIGENYVAVGAAKIRQGASEKDASVGQLRKGEVVAVTGKVQGQPWLMIAQDGLGAGFVRADLLKPTTAVIPVSTEPTVLKGEIEQRSVQVARTCRTVTQTVTVNGKDTNEDVTACQGPNGWEIS